MKAIRLHIKQNSANYRREETVGCRMTFPLPPYSTVIGALHKACGYTEYHPMKISIQGKYGSLNKRLFKEDCFLNRLEDDRGILVKMENPNMLNSAYTIVAKEVIGKENDSDKPDISGIDKNSKALKRPKRSFDEEINILVENQSLLNEYRFLNKTKRRIKKNKNVIKKYKDKLKEMKSKEDVSPEELKAFANRVKNLEKAYKKYEEVKYTIPKSYFRTLTKAPKWCELLCDIELIIHISSDDQTLNDIQNNIGNLTAIGRSEDFVEVLDCTEVELVSENVSYFNNKNIDAYIPIELLENNEEVLRIKGPEEANYGKGTKYLLNKDYKVEKLKDGYRNRLFNKVPVLYTGRFSFEGNCNGIYLDKLGTESYAVFFA